MTKYTIKYVGFHGPWEGPFFVWRPVKDIHGRRHWLRKVYRREKNRMIWPQQGWEYGTFMDVVRDV